MLKRKLSTILLCAVLLGNSFVSISTVSANSTITSTASVQKVAVSKADESNLKKSINEALSLKYDVLKTGKSKDYSHITKDSKLLKLLNEKSNFDVEWFKKFNGKTKKYTSNITMNIDAIAYSGYNATNAVAYAHKYATYPNTQYRNFDSNGGDCTNFTSQCVLAGGIPASSSWYAYSNSWIKVIDFFAYMTNNGYASFTTV